ncbi:MAG: fatty acid-binding protein DegV [Haloplasmataceae bacterium]|jgi:DegV family protein with EDD domain|nr:fatty acid-binding protein DegV [Haloplasmataceae bacterium]
MKPKIAILTDSSSSLYKIKHNYENLFMINIPCFIDGEIYTDFDKNGDETFYNALIRSVTVPKTSQPSVGETVEKYEYIKSLGYTNIIYLPLSKELSGTYQNGYLAKEMVTDIEVEIVDTLTTVSILGNLAIEAARLARLEFTVEQITSKILELKAKTSYYVTVNDLTSLVKNGRLSNAKSIVANLLKIKPVIKLTDDGKIVSLENVRTFKGAIKSIIDRIAVDLDTNHGVLHVAFTNNNSDLEYVESLLKERFPQTKIEIYTLSATIVAHVGLETIAIGYVNY